MPHIMLDSKKLSPGETLRGRITGLERGSKLKVRFGPRECGRMVSDAAVTRETDQAEFSFEVPEGPFSFKGKDISVDWAVEAVSGPWQDEEPVEVVPGQFTGKPHFGHDDDWWDEDDLTEEVHWAHPALAYFGGGTLVLAGLILYILFGPWFAALVAAGAAIAARGWWRHRRASAAGSGKAILSGKRLRPGERLSVQLTVVSPDAYDDATLTLSLVCGGDYCVPDEEETKDGGDEETFHRFETPRRLGSVQPGVPISHQASWEMPAGPFSHMSDDLEIEWWVNAELKSGGKVVWDWSSPLELRP